MRGLIRHMFFLPGLFIAAFLPAAPAFAQLPPRIMADRYLIKAEQLEAEKDYAGALKAIGQAIALQKKHKFKLPDEFQFKYARIALAADSIRIAYESVNRYLSIAGPDGEFYKEALKLSLEVEAPEILPEDTCDGKPVGSSCWMPLANRPECYVWNVNLQEDATVKWTGGCGGGAAWGEGTLTWDYIDADSNRVTQSFAGRMWKGVPDGHAVLRFPSGSTSEGPFVKGKEHGQWNYKTSDGSTGQGPMVNGKQHGQWIHRDSDGSTREGPWVQGKQQGRWVHHNSDGSTREGSFVNGERQGLWVENGTEKGDCRGSYVRNYRHGEWVCSQGREVRIYSYERGIIKNRKRVE